LRSIALLIFKVSINLTTTTSIRLKGILMTLMNKKILKIIYLCSLIALPSCTFLIKTNKQAQTLSHLGQISGTVSGDGLNGTSIVVGMLKHTNGQVQMTNQKQLDENAAFTFNLPEDQYYLVAYIDENQNFRRDSNERSTMYQSKVNGNSEIILKKNQHQKNITIEFKSLTNNILILNETYTTDKITDNIGKIVSLDSPLFDQENVKLGFWHPIDFVDQVVGGLFLLKPYEQDKTPVIFIHGIMGNPQEFSAVINKLNKNKFQPWVLYYPTGVPLDYISQYLVDALHALHHKYKFNNVQLISHSMGGLIARSYINKHSDANQLFDISLYITINSPLNGLDSAARGVESSPVIIASWRDLASNSKFIKSLHNRRLPKSIPYHLFFSYLDGENGDGLIPLTSQLSVSLQEEALRIYANEASHAGILRDEQFIKRLSAIINSPGQ